MKKIYLLITIFALMLAGCGDSNNVSNKKDEVSSKKATESTTNVAEITSDTTAEADTKRENISEEADSTAENSNVSEQNNTTTNTTTKNTTTTEQTTAPINEDSTTNQQAQVPSTTKPQTQESITTETTSEYASYDTSGYSPTDAELLSESNTKSAANMSYYNEVLTLVNQIRAEAGVAPLTLDTTLCQAATMRAVEMNYSNLFSHTRPNGTSCFSVLDTYNISYRRCGENIAAGYTSPSAVVTGWKNSPGHYANMIDESFTKLGVGMSNEAPGTYSHYWVQLFIS